MIHLKTIKNKYKDVDYVNSLCRAAYDDDILYELVYSAVSYFNGDAMDWFYSNDNPNNRQAYDENVDTYMNQALQLHQPTTMQELRELIQQAYTECQMDTAVDYPVLKLYYIADYLTWKHHMESISDEQYQALQQLAQEFPIDETISAFNQAIESTLGIKS
jgi:hypothetical protein